MTITNIFIPGFNNNKSEFESTKKILEENGVEDIHYFDAKNYVKGKKLHSVSLNLFDGITNIVNNGKINLICHSMGCNYGIIAIDSFVRVKNTVMISECLPSLNKIVLISPELVPITKEEQQTIDRINFEKNYYDEEQSRSSLLASLSLKKLILIKKFIETRRLASQVLESNKQTHQAMIIHSSGDRFISKIGIETILSSTLETEEIVVPSTAHNPFLSNNGPEISKRIALFLK